MVSNRVKDDLKELRRLRRRGRRSVCILKYEMLFDKLPPLQSMVMTECYINGLSYYDCGSKIGYSERQIKRIVRRSMENLSILSGGL
jgi:hypothetical protein